MADAIDAPPHCQSEKIALLMPSRIGWRAQGRVTANLNRLRTCPRAQSEGAERCERDGIVLTRTIALAGWVDKPDLGVTDPRGQFS
jgi:hypothetical protein